MPVEVAPEQRPGSSLGPASPSQLTDPELIIINEQLGPAPWDLSWQRHSAHQHLPALASQGVAIQGAEVRDSQASYGAGKVQFGLPCRLGDCRRAVSTGGRGQASIIHPRPGPRERALGRRQGL